MKREWVNKLTYNNKYGKIICKKEIFFEYKKKESKVTIMFKKVINEFGEEFLVSDEEIKGLI